MANQLTFTRFTDLVLARLYEAEQREGRSGVLFDVAELVSDVIPLVPDDWAWQAAQYLKDHGLANGALSMGGSAHMALTGDGRVYVERDQGTGLISDYMQGDQVVFILGDGNQVAVGHGQTVTQTGNFEKEDVLEILDEAESRLIEAELTPGERGEAMADLATVRTQANKAQPNLGVIRAVIPALQAVAAISDLADKLRDLVG
jgi:hypothetical protein